MDNRMFILIQCILLLLVGTSHGLPDFFPDSHHLQQTLSIDYIDADRDPCLIHERCLNGPGIRKILRFATMIHNIGTEDAVLGQPPALISPNNPNYWHFDECHRHWHFTAYADYQLYDSTGTRLILEGHKNGFCLEDVQCVPGKTIKYNCNNQGVQAGCYDLYDDSLPCQWIDITDLEKTPGYTPDVEYSLRVTVNRHGFFPEISTFNNQATAKVIVNQIPVRASEVNQTWFIRGEGGAVPAPGGL